MNGDPIHARPWRPLSLPLVLLLLNGCAAEVEPLPPDHEVAATDSPLLYAGETYLELTQNPGRPLNAIGYLSNGCTAFLIDTDTIAAAAHCFTVWWEDPDSNIRIGDWQQNLRFYPNFHPDRVTANPNAVPRAEVSRVVVGTRAGLNIQDSGFGQGGRNDWAIAKLKNWRDNAGLDLTPVPLSNSVPWTEGTTIFTGAYIRHRIPVDGLPPVDTSAPHWDDITWDGSCNQWAVKRRTTPNIAPPAPGIPAVPDPYSGCSSRWAAGYAIDGQIRLVENGLITHNISVHGGSSGSPVLGYQNQKYQAYGVTYGGSYYRQGDNPAEGAFHCTTYPNCVVPQLYAYDRTRLDRMNYAVSADRFIQAPRRAYNVSIGQTASNGGTAIFATDADRDVLVHRERIYPPEQGQAFGHWSSLGTPDSSRDLYQLATCSHSTNKPQVIVIASGKLFHRYVLPNTWTWSEWNTFALPGGNTSVKDVDVMLDRSNRCQLVAIGNTGHIYTRVKNGNGPLDWGSWSLAASGPYTHVSALRYNDLRYIAMINPAGKVWYSSQSTAGTWATPVQIPGQDNSEVMIDVDMTHDEFGRGLIFALDDDFTKNLMYVPMYGPSAFSSWFHLETKLHAHNAPANRAPTRAPDLNTITAGSWLEGAAGSYSPVIFGTDDWGNVYFIEYTRAGNRNEWVLEWKSFYDNVISYSD